MQEDTINPGPEKGRGNSSFQVPQFIPDDKLGAEYNFNEEDLVMEAVAEIDDVMVYTTSQVVEFLDRSSPWLYLGLSAGHFTDDKGVPIQPRKRGSRRVFTPADIRNIMESMFRRGVINPEEAKVILRRLHYADLGIEWREKEGWKNALMGRNRRRWVRPEFATWDKDRGWIIKPGVKYKQ